MKSINEAVKYKLRAQEVLMKKYGSIEEIWHNTPKEILRIQKKYNLKVKRKTA